MLQFEELSAAVRNIVDNYLSENVFLSYPKKMELMASLYAMMDGANPEVLDILQGSVKDLNDTLSTEEIELLRSEYPSVMHYCFEKKDPFTEAAYRVDQYGYTNKTLPMSLLELCLKLASPEKGQEVFLPYAGYAQMASLLPDVNCGGFEKNADRWALSQMMLHASGIPTSIMLTDDMYKSMPEGKQYDYIFCMPPFARGKEMRGVVDNIYELATKHLAENGSLCCILPESFCYSSSGWLDVRKILWDYPNQYSAIVITLPQLHNMFSLANLCVFCLVKNGHDDIWLMDASRNDAFVVMHDRDVHESWYLNVDSIIATLEHGSLDFCWACHANQLKSDVDLTPSHYLVNNIIPIPNTRKGEKLCRIGDLITTISTERIGNKESMLPLLGMKDLSDNYFNCDIPFNTVPTKKFHSTPILRENCLLAGFIGGKFKVGKTIDLSEEQYIALQNEIIPFRLKKNALVIEEYFLRSLILNDNLKTQANMLSKGIGISRLDIKDFLNLQIVTPSLEEQEKICKTDARRSLADADIKQKKIDEDFRRDIHMKKHAIGQTIFNLNNWWKVLLRARKEGNGVVDDNTVIGRIEKVAVKDVYDNIQQTIEHLQQQITRFDIGYGLVTEKIPLTTFIEEYISNHKSPIFRYEYDASTHHHSLPVGVEEVYDESGQLVGLRPGEEIADITIEEAVFPPDALTIIFDNIVSNACSHGFMGRENNPDSNIIKIELSMDGTDCIISISNNGKPVPENVTEDYVFTYNHSTQLGNNHDGIGGYEVKRLMQEYDGDAEFISQPESAFPVTYKLVFHNTGFKHFDLE